MTATVVGALELTRLILANRTEIVAAEGDVVGLAAGSPHRGIVMAVARLRRSVSLAIW